MECTILPIVGGGGGGGGGERLETEEEEEEVEAGNNTLRVDASEVENWKMEMERGMESRSSSCLRWVFDMR